MSDRRQGRRTDFHRPVPNRLNLAELFCWEESRTVQNDWTIRYNNRFYQILKENRQRPKPKQKVVVRVLLDESMQIVHRDKKLKYKPITEPPVSKTHTVAPVIALEPARQWKPAPEHPWRRYGYGRKRAACARRASG